MPLQGFRSISPPGVPGHHVAVLHLPWFWTTAQRSAPSPAHPRAMPSVPTAMPPVGHAECATVGASAGP